MRISEENFLPKLWTDFRDSSLELLGGNLILSIMMVPVLLLGWAGLWLPGLVIFFGLVAPWITSFIGMAGVCAKGKVPRFKHYFSGYQQCYRSSLLWWSPLVLLGISCGMMWELITLHQNAAWLLIPLGFGLGFILVLSLLITQAVTLLVLYHLPAGTCWKYALFLCVKYRNFSFAWAGFTVLTVFVISWSKMALLLILPAFWALVTANLVLLEVELEKGNEGEAEADANETGN